MITILVNRGVTLIAKYLYVASVRPAVTRVASTACTMMAESPTQFAMNLLPIPRKTPSAAAYTITSAGFTLRENDSTIARMKASRAPARNAGVTKLTGIVFQAITATTVTTARVAAVRTITSSIVIGRLPAGYLGTAATGHLARRSRTDQAGRTERRPDNAAVARRKRTRPVQDRVTALHVILLGTHIRGRSEILRSQP